MTYTVATKPRVQSENSRIRVPSIGARAMTVASNTSAANTPTKIVHGRVERSIRTSSRCIPTTLAMASFLLLAGCGDAASSEEQLVEPVSGRTATALRVAGIAGDSLTEFAVNSGDTIAQAITAQLVDARGLAVAKSGVLVTVAVTDTAGLPVPGAQVLSGDTATTAADGIATFLRLAILGPARSGRLTFAAPPLAPTRWSIRLRPGAASMQASAVTVLPDTVPVGGTSQVTIVLLDAAGNRLGAGQSVAVSMTGGTSAATHSAPTFNAADSTYRLTLTGVTAGTASTVTVTVSGRALATTRQLTISAPVVPPVAATRLAFTLLPGDTTAGIVVRSGSTLAQTVAELRTATNNTVAQSGIAMSASVTNPVGGALTGGTITGAGPDSTSSNGSAVFPAIGVSGRVGQARVQLSSSGLAPVSFPITIAAGAPSAGVSTMTLSADTVPVGSSSLVTVLPRDAQSNLLGGGQTVSVTATGGTSTGTVGSVTFNAGDSSYRATFTGTGAGTAMTVRSVAAGTTLTQTRSVRVTAGPVSASTTTLAVSLDTVSVGGTSVVTIAPRDALGNKRGAGLAVSVTATGGTSAGTLSAVTYSASDSTYRSTFTGTSAGSALTVRATVTAVAITATRPLTVRAAPTPPTPPSPSPSDTSWTFCSNEGGFCENFTGLRTVRLVASSGQFVTQDAFGRILCRQGSFSAQLPSGSNVSRCDVGQLRTEVITNPSPGMSGLLGATLTVPMGDPGQGVALIRPSTSQPGVLADEGNFRMECGVTKFGFFDPIVYPDQPLAGHLHMFFGNAGVNGSSTTQSIASSGNSTCHGGTANRTSYWFPAVFDAVTQEIQIPVRGTFYYKSHILPPEGLQPIPAGLRMIAGNKNATGKQSVAEWYCSRTNIPNTEGFIPDCPVGEELRLSIAFPECWNGRDLDSPDHQSHMAYAIYVNGGTSYCPSTHPIGLPRLEEIIAFPVTANSRPLRWRLSSDMYSSSIRGGRSAHADWMDGWSRDAMTTFTRECVNKRRDSTFQLCDGRDLYYVP